MWFSKSSKIFPCLDPPGASFWDEGLPGCVFLHTQPGKLCCSALAPGYVPRPTSYRPLPSQLLLIGLLSFPGTVKLIPAGTSSQKVTSWWGLPGPSVFMSWDCHNKMSPTGWLKITDTCRLTRRRRWQSPALPRALGAPASRACSQHWLFLGVPRPAGAQLHALPPCSHGLSPVRLHLVLSWWTSLLF